MKKRGLGRSLNAILSSVSVQDNLPVMAEEKNNISENHLSFISVTELVRGEYQPRREMDEKTIDELAASIKAHGILQPIVVRRKQDKFEIIAGERRWRAAQKAGLAEVPVIIKEIPDDAAMAIGLIENIQRENLNAIDEAFGLQRLMQEFSLTHQEIADAVGRSRAAVSNLLRLLNLPEVVQKCLQNGDLEMGHARALLTLPEAQQIHAAERVVDKGLSVRETEQYVKQLQFLNEGRQQVKATPEKSSELAQLQARLSNKFATKVNIQQNPKGRGKFVIHFSSSEALKKICQLMLED